MVRALAPQVAFVLGLAQGLNSNGLEARHSVRPLYTALDFIFRAHGNAPCHPTIAVAIPKKKKGTCT
jgi:hypothetical protein